MSETNTDVLGKIVQHPIDYITTLPVAHAPQIVRAICNEVDALCPVTAQPDHYVVEIEYHVRDSKVIESKSLKLYLWQFRDKGISCEELAATIAHDLAVQYAEQTNDDEVLNQFNVLVRQQSRGGIVLEAHATRSA